MTAPLRLGVFAAGQVVVFAASFAVASVISPDPAQTRRPPDHDRGTHSAVVPVSPAGAAPAERIAPA